MKKYKFFVRIFVYLLIFSLILALSVPFLLDRIVQLDKVKPEIESGLSEFFQRDWTIDSIEWNWFPRPMLSCHKVNLCEKDKTVLAQSPKILVYPALSRLLKKEVFIKELDIINPLFNVRRFKDGKINVSEIYKDTSSHLGQTKTDKVSAVSVVLRKLDIRQAIITLTDESLPVSQLKPRIIANAHFDIPLTTGSAFMDLTSQWTLHHLQGSVKMTGTLGPQYSLTTQAQNVPLSVLSDYYPPLENVAGRLSFKGKIKKAGDKIVWDFSGAARKVRPSKPIKFPLDINAKFTSRTDRPLMATIDFKGQGTQGALEVSSRHPGRRHFEAVGTFEKLDLNHVFILRNFYLKNSTETLAGSAPSSGVSYWTLESTVTAKKLTQGDKVFGETEIHLSKSPPQKTRSMGNPTAPSDEFETWELRDLHVKGWGGELAASGSVRQFGASPATFSARWKANQLDARAFQNALGLDFKTSGRLSSEGQFIGTLPQWRSNHLNGTFQMKLEDGILGGMGGLVKFLASFNIKSLIQPVDNNQTPGLPFTVMKGTFSVTNGIVKTVVPVKIESPTVDIALTGFTNVANNELNADGVVAFLNPIDETINLIPGTETILMNGKKTFLPIWIKMTGNVEDPRVEVRPFKSVGKKAWNTFIGVLKLPGAMLDFITDPLSPPKD